MEHKAGSSANAVAARVCRESIAMRCAKVTAAAISSHVKRSHAALHAPRGANLATADLLGANFNISKLLVQQTLPSRQADAHAAF
jgi:hypothetical protein